ncbi:hypothetical protein [Sphingomonas crocodyli]|uniref:Uncharacterized protein n=1 Tax=Sphingomonas crocodyli TaxID=1979270 RepID=A0A437MB12_9SPHN|nr:hypothetical protein [Sphingomonas crocodyli]RVT94831.1 hypothetical protein EOD43_13730 [Sphingomonas crocodyli]
MALGRLVSALLCAVVLAGPASAARLELQLGAVAHDDRAAFHPGRWSRPQAIMVRVTTAAPAAAAEDGDDRQRLTGYALTGDVPLGEGWRMTAGFREDGNRQLLRSAFGDEVSTQQYAPMMAVGYGAEAAPGLTIGGDIGMVRQSRSARISDGSTLLSTPMDMRAPTGGRSNDYRPMLTFSAGYRF